MEEEISFFSALKHPIEEQRLIKDNEEIKTKEVPRNKRGDPKASVKTLRPGITELEIAWLSDWS